MTEKTLRVLEFTKIREYLSTFALTELGRDKCLALVPFQCIEDVQFAQDETEEAVVITTYIGGNPLVSFKDVSDTLSLSKKGATLSQKALLQVKDVLSATRNAKKVLVTERENTPILTRQASTLQPFRMLEQDIADCILSEDEMADRASTALYDIRTRLRRANEKVREKLTQMAHGSQTSKYLQEGIVTMRNGRYVLPVRAEYRQSVPGLVHDQSATGATLFIEPLAVVELSNEIKTLQIKEREEIERILAALSFKVGEYSEEIKENVDILVHLDFVFAKAMLSRAQFAIMPKLNNEGKIKFLRARHPLIDREKVVPCSLYLGEDFTTLVITGPNTGGKTVTLKTVGLLTVMAQSGLQVPAEIGTTLAVFRNVFADIGDEQSIEQSLSTFSSHMTNIVSIMHNVQPNDLVLFDELGAGTDPTEGAALAEVILDHLVQCKVRTVATTHYSELKAYALSTKGVENASVEFDVESLRPTYRLSIGVPGKSNAFEISRKLGLDDFFIDNAKELLSHETLRFEDVIKNAEYHKQVAEKERVLMEKAKQETVVLRNQAEKLYKELEEKERELTKKAKDKARIILEDARRESDQIISDLKRMKKNQNVQDHEVNALKNRLQKNIDNTAEGLKKNVAHQPVQNLKQGDYVDILTFNTKGTVLEVLSNDEVLVQAGIMKIKVKKSDLSFSQAQEKKKPKSQVSVKADRTKKQVSLSCDVRGHALDEALPMVDMYLDEAVMSGYNEVTIVHGKGMGILRSGIQQHLRKHKHVRSFRLGIFGEGEDGVTVVTLK